jgi:hypothetical protein
MSGTSEVHELADPPCAARKSAEVGQQRKPQSLPGAPEIGVTFVCELAGARQGPLRFPRGEGVRL